MIQWPRLLRFKQDDVLDIPEGSRSLIDEGVYSISDTQYCLADVINENGQDTLRVLSFYWAASQGAFRRACFREVESDDMALGYPPEVLIPERSGATYSQIKQALTAMGDVMEHASYRIMSDGAFIHKSLESASVVYHFRSLDSLDDELPYAIVWKCRRT
ncbi:hypothetical protein [Pseudomonas sp. TE3911]|jgi:hypothetical protein